MISTFEALRMFRKMRVNQSLADIIFMVDFMLPDKPFILNKDGSVFAVFEIGGMGTIHAGSAESTLSRMEALMKSFSTMREEAIRQLLRENIDIIIHVKTLGDRKKRVTDIIEVAKDRPNRFNSLYEFIPDKITKGAGITGRFEVKNRPEFLKERLFVGNDQIPFFWREIEVN